MIAKRPDNRTGSSNRKQDDDREDCGGARKRHRESWGRYGSVGARCCSN